MTKKPSDRIYLFGYKYNDKVPEGINASDKDAYNTKYEDFDIYNKVWEIIDHKEFKTNHRHRIKLVLDNGGSVVLSLRHKGDTKDSHIVSVQSINSDGLILDDPYGSHASSYKFGESGDLFAGKDKDSKQRGDNGEPYRNTKHFNTEVKDYTKRDFTAEAAQNLENDESKGASQLLKWSMINDSNYGFIKYIVYYEKK